MAETGVGRLSGQSHRPERLQLTGRQQQLEQRNQRRLNSNSNLLLRLIGSLDLRFTDPRVESAYHKYYAEVKRNLLPTAIRIVLLVNVLQFLATCLNYYLLAEEQEARRSASSSSSSFRRQEGQEEEEPGSRPTSGRLLERYARTLYWPLGLQLLVFAAALAMFKLVRDETAPGQGPEPGSHSTPSPSAEALAGRKRRSAGRLRSNSSQWNGDESAADWSEGEEDEEEEDGAGVGVEAVEAADEAMRRRQVALRNDSRRSRAQSSRHSVGSGLSASLSLAIEMASDSEASEAMEMSPRQTGGGGRQRGPRSGRWRPTSDFRRCSASAGLSRFKLSLPYLLWLCQLAQVASGLWPHQSFIAYSTLLLYSYAIYVILPIRLHSCALLAAGLSLLGPLLDYLLLAQLRASFGSARAAAHLAPAEPLARLAPNSANASAPAELLIHSELEPAALAQVVAAAAAAAVDAAAASANNDHHHDEANLLDTALAIPMTSQLSKVSGGSGRAPLACKIGRQASRRRYGWPSRLRIIRPPNSPRPFANSPNQLLVCRPRRRQHSPGGCHLADEGRGAGGPAGPAHRSARPARSSRQLAQRLQSPFAPQA